MILALAWLLGITHIRVDWGSEIWVDRICKIGASVLSVIYSLVFSRCGYVQVHPLFQ